MVLKEKIDRTIRAMMVIFPGFEVLVMLQYFPLPSFR